MLPAQPKSLSYGQATAKSHTGRNDVLSIPAVLDGYDDPEAVSADGRFAYVSDRGGNSQVWLQQVAGSESIQVTHSSDTVTSVNFFPDGARLLYSAYSADGGWGSLEVISTLGGQPRVLAAIKPLPPR